MADPAPGISREDVVTAYRRLLGREPESEAAISAHQAHGSFASLVEAFTGSAEFRRRLAGANPLYHYHASVDVRAIIERHLVTERQPSPGNLVNFLGVAMPTRFMPHLGDRGGQLEGLPIPTNHHADMAEWAAALRSVELARSSYTLVELGCGWGCWMNNMGVVAKRRGLPTLVVGVEADPAHLAFAAEALALNRFVPGEFRLTRGIAAASGGSALFPRAAATGHNWGLAPLIGVAPALLAEYVESGRYELVPLVSLDEVFEGLGMIDLLHVDIQGGEAALVREALPLLTRRVAYLVIGTHSRQIEGQLIGDLFGTGAWSLEIERPAILAIESGKEPRTVIDGVQAWRNRLVRPD